MMNKMMMLIYIYKKANYMKNNKNFLIKKQEDNIEIENNKNKL